MKFDGLHLSVHLNVLKLLLPRMLGYGTVWRVVTERCEKNLIILHLPTV